MLVRIQHLRGRGRWTSVRAKPASLTVSSRTATAGTERPASKRKAVTEEAREPHSGSVGRVVIHLVDYRPVVQHLEGKDGGGDRGLSLQG